MLLGSVLLTSCVSGDTKDTGGTPRRELAATPDALPPATPAVPVPGATSASPGSWASATFAPSPTASLAPGASSAPATGGPAASSAAAAPFHVVGATSDGTGDSEGTAQPYSDLVAVTIEDDGTNARVTVTFRGDVPARLPAGETMGVGVDFFRSSTQIESDYQLFADGEPDGWFAYLQTPKGFVRFPGHFAVGGPRLQLTVPWSAIGSPASGRFSAFADWTRKGTVTNTFSEDHAPNLGTAAFSR